MKCTFYGILAVIVLQHSRIEWPSFSTPEYPFPFIFCGPCLFSESVIFCFLFDKILTISTLAVSRLHLDGMVHLQWNGEKWKRGNEGKNKKELQHWLGGKCNIRKNKISMLTGILCSHFFLIFSSSTFLAYNAKGFKGKKKVWFYCLHFVRLPYYELVKDIDLAGGFYFKCR